MSLKIEKIDTNKHKIRQRELMNAGVIPHFPSISIFCGSQGGGKSTLVANLLTNPIMYGPSHELMEKELKRRPDTPKRGYFDAIFLLIGSDDDMYDHLIENDIIKANHVCHMPTPADIQLIIDGQKKAIENAGNISRAPKILVIFDDVVNDGSLLRSKPFLEIFVKGRHINSSCFFLSQYLNLVPKSCRMQANYTFMFKCNRAEIEILANQYTPPNMTKKEFAKMVCETVADTDDNKNNFLLICKRAPEDQRFRKNLDKFVTLKRLKYKPTLTVPSRSPKEIEDLDFDVEMNIKKIDQEYADKIIIDSHMTTNTYIEPNVEQYSTAPNNKKGKSKNKKGRPRKNRYYTKG